MATWNMANIGWIWQRIDCCLHGHRDLTKFATYSSLLPDGQVRDLHFCLACDSPVWITHPPTDDTPDLPPDWLDTR